MKVTIDKKWHYVAKDLNGLVFVYTSKPYISGNAGWMYSDGSYQLIPGTFHDIQDVDWKQSLRKINHETGELEVIINLPKLKVDTKVIVRHRLGDKSFARYFSHFKNGKMCCFDYGATSWSNGNTSHIEWEYWFIPETGESNIPNEPPKF